MRSNVPRLNHEGSSASDMIVLSQAAHWAKPACSSLWPSRARAQACRTRYKRVHPIPPELNAGRELCCVQTPKWTVKPLDKGHRVQYNNKAFGKWSRRDEQTSKGLANA